MLVNILITNFPNDLSDHKFEFKLMFVTTWMSRFGTLAIIICSRIVIAVWVHLSRNSITTVQDIFCLLYFFFFYLCITDSAKYLTVHVQKEALTLWKTLLRYFSWILEIFFVNTRSVRSERERALRVTMLLEFRNC